MGQISPVAFEMQHWTRLRQLKKPHNPVSTSGVRASVAGLARQFGTTWTTYRWRPNPTAVNYLRDLVMKSSEAGLAGRLLSQGTASR